MSFEEIIHPPSTAPAIDDIGAVLVGFDLHINYKKIAKAFHYLKYNDKCHFVATNNDLTYPNHGHLFPGTGALLSTISAPLQREPIICGKPTKTMLDCIIRK